MKTCSNCGHENMNNASRCEECGWVVPKIHPYAPIGRVLKITAGSIMTVLVALQLVGVVAVKMTVPTQDEDPAPNAAIFGFYMWRWFLILMAVLFLLFWLGD